MDYLVWDYLVWAWTGLIALLFIGYVLRRIQFETYPFSQGWWLIPTIALVPKSVPIGGVHYVVVSFFFLGFEIRWFAWRRAKRA